MSTDNTDRTAPQAPLASDDAAPSSLASFIGKANRVSQSSSPAPQATAAQAGNCLLYTSPSPRDGLLSRMPSSA